MVLLVNKVFLGVYGNADGILCQSVSAVKQKNKVKCFPHAQRVQGNVIATLHKKKCYTACEIKRKCVKTV